MEAVATNPHMAIALPPSEAIEEHVEKPSVENPTKNSFDQIKELFNEESENSTNKKSDSPLMDFIDKHLVKYTTFSSVVTNLISAPVRLLDDNNPWKKMINALSMVLTRAHQAAYAVSGVDTARKQKNPFLIFSFITEGLAAVFGLRQIYLFRGIATGVDGAVAALKERFEAKNPGKTYEYSSFKEGWNHGIKDWGKIIKEIKENPMELLNLNGVHTLVSSSIMMILGAVFGITINDKAGGSVRDFFGGLNDFGLTQLDNSVARKSGAFYLMGTAKDFIARFFSDKTAKLFNVQDTTRFKRMRDFFHEWALAFDRLGQYFFLRYNQQKNKPVTV